MKERFEGDGAPDLIDALKRQEVAAGNGDIVAALIKHGALVEFTKGDRIIVEDGVDNDVFFLVSGSVSVSVKGKEVATRTAGEIVGEMAAIEPAQKRAATVTAHDTVVALKVSSAVFGSIGREFPQVWKPIAQELSRRLFQRNHLIQPPNESPRLFIMSSVEALPIAYEIQSALQHDVLPTVWTQGVFFASGYPLEALEKSVRASDFAVAVAQPDDIIETRGERHQTLRDNVLFELGLFMGVLTRFRTFLVHPKVTHLKLPSDLHGLGVLSYPAGNQEDLGSRLGSACNDIRKRVKALGVRPVNG